MKNEAVTIEELHSVQQVKPESYSVTKNVNRLWMNRILIGVVFLAFWQFASGRLIKPFWVSDPYSIALRLYEWFSTGFIWIHIQATLSEMLIGLALGSLLAVIGGLLLGSSRFLGDVFYPIILGLYSVPRIALVPLFVVWFGIGMASKVVLVTVVVFFLVFFNAFTGVRDVDQDLINTLRIMGASKRDIFLKVIIPGASRWVFTGLRLAVPYSLMGAVTGEIIVANQGIGYLVSWSSGMFDSTGMMAALFILMICGVVADTIVTRVESKALIWKRNE
ncbi:ABC transporter permease [Aneurinibacillus danicus]|jgi:NitT/TauT family transport system permease protein|uniref:ABC transporter permease n=1 Tax=Aneurinibacillus danicus TaxID=267746 RepID=A0A511VES2_9BACL|nr:ABC transporter permease [Aneurinibacillus danicus]GEN36468.1 ABC transporter permease [Aneurinibacillus danicus]